MKINKKLIEEKYREMKPKNEAEGFIDIESLGGIKIFINKEPKNILFFIDIAPDRVYLGTE